MLATNNINNTTNCHKHRYRHGSHSHHPIGMHTKLQLTDAVPLQNEVSSRNKLINPSQMSTILLICNSKKHIKTRVTRRQWEQFPDE